MLITASLVRDCHHLDKPLCHSYQISVVLTKSSWRVWSDSNSVKSVLHSTKLSILVTVSSSFLSRGVSISGGLAVSPAGTMIPLTPLDASECCGTVLTFDTVGAITGWKDPATTDERWMST